MAATIYPAKLLAELPEHPMHLPVAKRPAQAQPARSGASTPAAPQPRKCLKDGRTTYTDQPCPKGAQELPVDGAVTSLPRPQY